MKRLFEKWYISLFILPILLTYFTSLIQLPDILANWEYSIISSLFILVLVLIYEIQVLNKKIITLKSKPSERDKKIIKDLLKTIDLKVFQEDIYKQDAWNGYPREAIHNIINFEHEAILLENRTSVKALNDLIDDFLNELNRFTEYSSVHLYGRDEWLIPFKDNPDVNPREKVKKETEVMNDLSKNCFDKLEKLMFYLRTKEYL